MEDNYYYSIIDGLKIRDCLKPYRLDEVGETHEEYKLRMKLTKKLEKDIQKSRGGKLIWDSSKLGMITQEKVLKLLEHQNRDKYGTNR